MEKRKNEASRGQSVVLTGPDRAKMKTLKSILEYFAEFEKLKKQDPKSIDTGYKKFRHVMVAKFKSLKKAFTFFDFNANGSLAFIEFSSGMDLLFPVSFIWSWSSNEFRFLI